MKATDLDAGYYSPEKDNYEKQNIHDTRRPKITLAHLNQLKKMRAAKKLENLVRRDLMGLLYGTPESNEGGGGGMIPGL